MKKTTAPTNSLCNQSHNVHEKKIYFEGYEMITQETKNGIRAYRKCKKEVIVYERKSTKIINFIRNHAKRSRIKNNLPSSRQRGYQHDLQQCWFGLLAYIISIGTMILRVLNLNQETADFLSLITYVLTLFIWLFLVKLKTDQKQFRILELFNQCTGVTAILCGCLFYLFLVHSTPVICLWAVIIFGILFPFLLVFVSNK